MAQKASKPSPTFVKRLYLTLTLINTLAASLIWGINTLFLLSAGLSNAEAFLANAFFTVGQVLFEVPTGLVADVKGRRVSYLLGTITLSLSTLFYLWAWSVQAPFAIWAASSMLLGLGFTFFSGATEAWVVDALTFAGHTSELDDVFAQSQMVGGVAMLLGSVTGGILAQATNLSLPYLLRAGLLGVNFVLAFVLMRDWGFKPAQHVSIMDNVRTIGTAALKFGWHNRSVRWLMLAAPITSGIGFYAFYAMQPFLLELYGDPTAYAIAGLAAAIVAGAQIVGGMIVPKVRKVFPDRTSLLLTTMAVSTVALAAIGFVTNFWVAIGLLCVWGLVFACAQPVRQAYLNTLIPSSERATVLSFDSLLGSSGGVVTQPLLGRVADLNSYAASFLVGAVIQSFALPLVWLTRQARSTAEKWEK